MRVTLHKLAIKSNWIAPVGPFLDRFESRLKKYTGVKHALCVNSGTSAIHLALKVLGVKKDDIVLCKNFTFDITILNVSSEIS